MARMSYLNPQDASPKVAARLRQLPPLNVFRLVANAEGVFEPWLDFADAVLNAAQLDIELRQVCILRVTAISPGADYAREQHEAISRDMGIDETRIQGALSGEGLKGDDELVATFSEQVVREVSPDDTTWGRAADRFSDREVIELLFVIGYYMLMSRVVATARVDPDPPVGTALFPALGSDPGSPTAT
jgi:4-carboxymuconolactone decarboxylase